jgi:hypothetical protein
MNMINTAITNADPVVVDMVRQLPRKVVGFHCVIETEMDIEDIRASLEGMAENSAFDLVELEERGEDTKDGGRCLRAEFKLRARNGTVGDPQIFALLREIAARHRWNSMEKRIAR